MPRMWLAHEIHQDMRALDPNTALTKGAIRRLANNGTIPSVRIGRKILINYDCLLEYLSTPAKVDAEQEQITGEIRKVV